MSSDFDSQKAFEPSTAEELFLGGGQAAPSTGDRSALLLEKGPASGQKTVESHHRSVIKAISWRATGTLDTMVISFLVTGQLKLALSIGFVELFTKIGLYYLHERIWNKIRYGRVKVTDDYQI